MLSAILGMLLLLNVQAQQDALEELPDIKTEVVNGTLNELPATLILTLDQSIQHAASMYNVSYTRLRCLAQLESTMNPNAVSPGGRYHGLTQFDSTTWQLTPYRTSSVYDGYANIHAAAYLISIGQSSRWPVWRYCN